MIGEVAKIYNHHVNLSAESESVASQVFHVLFLTHLQLNVTLFLVEPYVLLSLFFCYCS